jgi:hypothetical protein
MNREMDRQSLIWGGLLVVLGAMLFVQTLTDIGVWIWVAVLGGFGLAVYAVYAMERKEKWMLIVSYVFLAIALMLALLELEILGDSWVATFVLGSIALPFLYVYLSTGYTQWWFLVPAYALLAIGIMVPMLDGGILEDELVPAYVFFVIALPFYVVYVRNRKLWWALIPAGVMTLMALAFFLAADTAEFILPVALMIIGAVILARQFFGQKTVPEVTDSEG